MHPNDASGERSLVVLAPPGAAALASLPPGGPGTTLPEMAVAGSPTAALRALAMHHVRRGWRASVAIAVFAGLVAAVPMALLSTARYGERAFDRFVSWSDPPELVVNVCPPGLDPEVDGIDGCIQGVDLRADAHRIAGLDHVRSARVGGYVFGQGGADPDPATWGPPLGGYAGTGAAPTTAGRPVIVEGRVAHRDAADEVTISETAARRLGIGVGDAFHIGAPGSDDVVTSTVVGVVRVIDHFLPVDDATSASFHVREGWLAANADRVVSFDAVIVQTEDGFADDVAAAIPRAFEGQRVNVDLFVPADQHRISNQALAFESDAMIAVAAASALAGAALVSQVVSRRSRVELAQAATLRALGATDRFLAGSVALRWAPVAAGAVAVAVVAVALSPALGPFGVARRAPWSASPRLDGWVVAAGVVLLPLCLLAAALLTVRRRTAAAPRVAGAVGPGVVSRVAATFLRQSLERRSVGSMVTAVVVSGVALAALMGAVTVTASLERVVSEPHRFGAPFDALIPAALDEPTALAGMDGIVGATIFAGTDARIAGEKVWVQAVKPFAGVDPVPPVVYEGRAPATEDEVALAPVTLREVGLSVGDVIQIPDADDELIDFHIVGVAPITDGYEHNVGLGGLFTMDGLRRLDPIATTNIGDVGVRVDPERREEVLAAVQEAYPGAFVPFPVPATLGNARRMSGLPVLLALGGAAAAAATFAHALLVTTRQRRRDLAVLRALGVLRHQTFGVIAMMAVVLAAIVVAIGGIVGLVVGGWGWQLLSDSFGLSPAVSYPVRALVAAPVAAVIVSVLAATWPARRASGVRPGRVLRAD
jgi:ABC-type lipoprotein release transport system permease subunit